MKIAGREIGGSQPPYIKKRKRDNLGRYTTTSILDRFYDRCIPEPNTGCWIWIGGSDGRKNGYGKLKIGGKTAFAHRVAYELFKGRIPTGKVLDHLCRVRCCVNPDHLEPVTYKENAIRGNTGIEMANRAHCPQGHLYSVENTYIINGARVCRECSKSRALAYYYKKKGMTR